MATMVEGEGLGAGLMLQSTPRLQEFLRMVAENPNVSDSIKGVIHRSKWGQEKGFAVAIPFAFLRDVYGQLRRDKTENMTLPQIHWLLSESSFVLESPKPREKSEELKARLRKLQDMADCKEYDRLVHDITKHTKEPEHFSSYKEQLGFGIHVAVTMVTGFAFCYTIFRSQFPDTPVLHAAGGGLGLIIGMLLETVLFIVRDVQREKMEQMSRRDSERKSQEILRKQT